MTDPSPDPSAPDTRSGISSTQIFVIALVILAHFAIVGIAVLSSGTRGDRTAYVQSVISLATLAAGYYLGSSAASRDRDRRP